MKKIIQKGLLLFLFSFFSGMVLLAQTFTVRGKVTAADGSAIPGVTVMVKGTTNGTITDVEGNYGIPNISKGVVLVFSFIGMQTQEILIDQNTSLNVVLNDEHISLKDVVVVGYGVQKKETVTGALSTVSAKEIVEQPVSNVSQALAGRLPGLISNQMGGRPGKDAATIKIRGIGTLDAGAGSNPLILIDGIERDQTALNFLDPNEIESLSILKDASSTAVFGVRGANGVIIVTTKRGKVGPAEVNYKGSVAVTLPTFKINPVDSYTQTGMANEYGGFPANTTDISAPYPMIKRERFKGVVEGNPIDATDPFFYPNTNYADLMLKDFAMQQQHSLTINGGTEKMKYFASLGYYSQGGLFDNLNPRLDQSTSYRRYNYRTNMDFKLTNTTTAKINIGGSFNENTNLGPAGREPETNFYWSMLVHSSPWDGYVHDDKLVMVQENANSVLLNTDMRGYTKQLENTADYSFILEQNLDALTKGLSLKGTVSLTSYLTNLIRRDISDQKIVSWRPYLKDDGTVGFSQAKEGGTPENKTEPNKSRKQYYEVALNYNRSFNKHTITGLGLFNADKSFFTERDYNEIPRSYLGIVGRLTYNYANRYMVEYNLGYNGSENFAEGKRFGFFPAYSAGWTFTEEPWMKSLVGDQILSYGKFRFSYGLVGNDRMWNRFLYLPDKFYMDNYGYLGWFDYGSNFGLPGATVNYPVAHQGPAGNPNVTWETSAKINYGLDLVFLGDKFNLKFDYFTEDRKDILINQRVVPVYQQAGALALNLGQVENKGFEVELGWKQNINANTRFWVDFNYSFARNKIIELDEPIDPLEYKNQTGRRVGELWGYQQEGFFETVAEAQTYKEELWQRYSELNPGADKGSYQAYKIFTDGYDVSAGDLKFIDRNGDGQISDKDEGYLDKTSFPEAMFGLKLGVEHKGFSASVLLQGATNYSINTRTNYSPTPTKGTLLDFVLDRYTPERYEAGESIKYPRLLNTNDNWKFNGSFWMQDATYLRLKSVEVGYTWGSSKRIVNMLGLTSLRVYSSGWNLLTFSKIKTMDPETTNGVLRYPSSRVINLGVNLQF